MNNQQQAVMLRQALHALQRADKISGSTNNKKTIAALRQVLEQPADHIPDATKMVDKQFPFEWKKTSQVYDSLSCMTPFGPIEITWKGWDIEPRIAEVDEFPGGFDAPLGTPEEVQRACEAEYFRRIRSNAQPADHIPDAKKMIQPVAWWNPKKDTVSTDPVHRNNPDCVPLVPIVERGNE